MGPLIILCCFAFIAGFVEAVVGGGGLVQLPAVFLLFPQLSLVQTLGTNKTANLLGTAVSAWRYMKRVEIDWLYMRPAIITAFTGSFGGAMLVTYIRKEQFMPFIICVLLLMLAYTVMRKNLGLHPKEKKRSATSYYFFAIGMGAVTGMYDGLIGPGTGSLMIFSFIMLFGNDFLHASAHAKLLNTIANIAAVSLFIIKDGVIWHIALPVAALNMLGNYTGAHVALNRGNKFVRGFFIVVTLTLIIKLSYTYLLR